MNNLSRVVAATSHDAIVDSEGSPIYVGDVVAYIDRPDWNAGPQVMKGIVIKINYETKKIKLDGQSFNRVFWAHRCLNISKMFPVEQLKANEEASKRWEAQKLEETKQKRKAAVQTRYMLAAYKQNDKIGLCYIPVEGAPGKVISKQNLINAYNAYIAQHPDLTLKIATKGHTFVDYNANDVKSYELTAHYYLDFCRYDDSKWMHIEYAPAATYTKEIMCWANSNSTSHRANLWPLRNYFSKGDPVYNVNMFFVNPSTYSINNKVCPFPGCDRYDAEKRKDRYDALARAFKDLFKL